MAGRVLDLHLHLLDRQVVDRDGRMVCKVDDLELTEGAEGDLYVTALLTGQLALAPRLGGRLGHWVAAIARRLDPEPDPQPGRIDLALVQEIGSAIRLSTTHEQVHVAPLERWVDTHVVSRIPGSTHESE